MCDEAVTTGAGERLLRFEDVQIGLVLDMGDGQRNRPTEDRAGALLTTEMLTELHGDDIGVRAVEGAVRTEKRIVHGESHGARRRPDGSARNPRRRSARMKRRRIAAGSDAKQRRLRLSGLR